MSNSRAGRIKPTQAECAKRWREKNREKAAASQKAYEQRNPEKIAASSRRCGRAYNLALKREVCEQYGGAECRCCGESELLFLTIDHVNNDGAKHRESVSSGHLYRWLKKNGFPQGFQVLCYNCNCGRARNGGVCPHKTRLDGQ